MCDSLLFRNAHISRYALAVTFCGNKYQTYEVKINIQNKLNRKKGKVKGKLVLSLRWTMMRELLS